MCRLKTNRAVRLIAVAVTALGLCPWLTACSDLYFDHRDTIALGAGDAVAANEITQMVDPWPPNSGNRNIAFNGQKMQTAVERYRTGRVIPPINATTSEVEMPPGASAAPALPPPPTVAGGPATTAAAQ